MILPDMSPNIGVFPDIEIYPDIGVRPDIGTQCDIGVHPEIGAYPQPVMQYSPDGVPNIMALLTSLPEG